MPLKQVTVRNTATHNISRGNRVFPGRKDTVITIDPSSVKYSEISACVPLKILQVEDYPVVPKPKAVETEEGACPYCDYTANSKMGLYPHVRSKHPDEYEDFKESMKDK